MGPYLHKFFDLYSFLRLIHVFESDSLTPLWGLPQSGLITVLDGINMGYSDHRVTILFPLDRTSINSKVCFFFITPQRGVTVFGSWDYTSLLGFEEELLGSSFCFFLPCTYIIAHVIFFVNSHYKQNIL